MTKDALRLAAVVTFALATSSCTTMSEVGAEMSSAVAEAGSVLDPTNWFGDETPVAADGSLPDSAVTTPDLAAIPPRPVATATPESQTQVASALSADRAQTAYSAEALRGGSEAAAPPPPAAPRSSVLPGPAPAPEPAPGPTPAPLPDITPAAPAPAAPAASAISPPPSPAPVRPAATAQVPGAQPAVPPNATGGGRVAVNTTQPSDAALGFRPSSAPALDPSISQWVAPPIVAHYQQTAALAGVQGGASDVRVAPVAGAARVSPYAAIGARTPTAVVQFPGDGTLLSAQGRAQVRAAAQAFKAQGGQGSVRVVGHASSRTANMPVEQHLKVIFDKSQSRANAVAQELIRQGVPASKVLIEAVGDSQPIYYESMPEGENGNRRAEIFVQG